jgi:23S rRNA (cytidine1920-2'-O)/16S rRNA (cytidine1409-2'-O)-methyltransferase
MGRIRLDQLVVTRGLAPSRERARALVLAGNVSVGADVAIIAPDHPYVGRGGLKLAHALDTFHIAVRDDSVSTSAPRPGDSPM